MNQHESEVYIQSLLSDEKKILENSGENLILEALRDVLKQADQSVLKVRQLQEEQLRMQGEARAYAKQLIAAEMTRQSQGKIKSQEQVAD